MKKVFFLFLYALSANIILAQPSLETIEPGMCYTNAIIQESKYVNYTDTLYLPLYAGGDKKRPRGIKIKRISTSFMIPPSWEYRFSERSDNTTLCLIEGRPSEIGEYWVVKDTSKIKEYEWTKIIQKWTQKESDDIFELRKAICSYNSQSLIFIIDLLQKEGFYIEGDEDRPAYDICKALLQYEQFYKLPRIVAPLTPDEFPLILISTLDHMGLTHNKSTNNFHKK